MFPLPVPGDAPVGHGAERVPGARRRVGPDRRRRLERVPGHAAVVGGRPLDEVGRVEGLRSSPRRGPSRPPPRSAGWSGRRRSPGCGVSIAARSSWETLDCPVTDGAGRTASRVRASRASRASRRRCARQGVGIPRLRDFPARLGSGDPSGLVRAHRYPRVVAGLRMMSENLRREGESRPVKQDSRIAESMQAASGPVKQPGPRRTPPAAGTTGKPSRRSGSIRRACRARHGPT